MMDQRLTMIGLSSQQDQIHLSSPFQVLISKVSLASALSKTANIQKDGTYTVVPRMYGGITTPQDLKKIADVSIKYNLPLVKMTGGQQIGMMGVKKEELTKV